MIEKDQTPAAHTGRACLSYVQAGILHDDIFPSPDEAHAAAQAAARGGLGRYVGLSVVPAEPDAVIGYLTAADWIEEHQ